MICTECNHRNPPDARFCTNCGSEMGETCPSCRTAVEPGQNFCGTCGFDLRAARVHASGDNSPASHTPPHLARRILADRSSIIGERKRVTVMFADVVGSTAATEGADPEQAAEFLNTALGAMMDSVHRYEGTVNELLGDGLVALFGAPIAHEDHAARACLAAVGIDRAVREATGGTARSRVGLHSGEVFVQAIGTDLSLEYQALGPTVHLAARMEQMADPGSVRATAATCQLAEGFIHARSLGPTRIKGVSDPVEVFEVNGIAATSAWDARATRGLTTFVARDGELAVLRDALGRTESGEGQVVAIVGEPGMGKSRILHEFLSGMAPDTQVLRGHASPYDADTTYYALKPVVRSALGIDGPATTSYRAIETASAQLGDEVAATAPALSSVLDTAVPNGEWAELTPETRRRRRREAIRGLALALASSGPLVIAIEDMHWIDGESEAVIDDLVDAVGGSRILLALTHRTEYMSDWGTKSHFTRLRLPSLTGAGAEALLFALTGHDPSLEQLTPRLLARGEGAPLFLEECVRSLVEAGRLEGELGGYRAVGEATDVDIPDSVQSVLAARIDRLHTDEKLVVQAASVIGEAVDAALLGAVASDIDLTAILPELQSREMLYASGVGSSTEYRFKHALTRDVAYESLPRSRRRELHAELVGVMQRSEIADEDQIERLAYHALRGELWPEAVEFAFAAGEKCIDRSAYAEAARFLRSAIDALDRLPQTTETTQQAIDIRMRQRVAETGAEGGFFRIQKILREASDLAADIDDRERMANVDIHLGYAANMQGDAGEAEEAGRRALAVAEQMGDRYLAAEARLVLGQTYDYAGRPREVIEIIESDLEYFGTELRYERRGQTMIRSVVAHAHVAIASALMGHFEPATRRAAEALQIAEEAARPFDLLYSHFAIGVCLDMEGRAEEAVASHQLAADIGDEFGLWFIRTFAQPWRGHALLSAGRVQEAVALLEDVRMAAERVGLPFVGSLAGAFEAEGRQRMGEVDVARNLAEGTLSFARDRGLPLVEIPSLRTLARTAEGSEAVDRWDQAERVADLHGYGPWLDAIRAERADTPGDD